MFIRAVKKHNPGASTIYTYHRLMESYRSSRGPRQRTVLNLGRLVLPKKKWKPLSDRIAQLLAGQKPLEPMEEQIEALAQHYAPLAVQCESRRETMQTEQRQPEYRRVDLNSIQHHRPRTIGAEYVGVQYLHKLAMHRIFRQVGLTEGELQIAQLLVVGRLVRPGSEKTTLDWAKHLSGIGELLGPQIKRLSHNALYRVSDKLYEVKEQIEGLLQENERKLFGLKEKVILYDLTNTYFDGSSYRYIDLKHCESKDRRNDCPLMSIGLVVDEWGFIKRSEFFSGKVHEPRTLERTIHDLGASENATVVVGAGIGIEENLKILRARGYHYVCVARGKPWEQDPDLEMGAVQIKAKNKGIVTEIQYRYCRAEETERRYSGRYYIRTSRTDLSEADLWQLYITLNGVRNSFRSLKSELWLRPVSHWAESRVKGNLFITLLSYHVLNAIRYRLRDAGYRMRWSELREMLSTHMISTTTINTNDCKKVSIRSTSKPEIFHRDIYRSLGLGTGPLRRRKTELPIGSVP